ncbi:MAG TPA: hypothetical protein PKK43_13365 [Spirochaetota bacterium]|nr:hypothetical protein [Spirochaetota bacterium]
MSDLKKAYTTIMDDHFPDEMKISFGSTTLVYRKRVWRLEDEGNLVEKGLRYGENPGQEAALYELVNGNLSLGGCRFIEPGNPLVSAIAEENLIQFGKHPGKTNLTDIDNSLNIMKYLMDRPATIIVKHNNPSGAAYGSTLAEYLISSLTAAGSPAISFGSRTSSRFSSPSTYVTEHCFLWKISISMSHAPAEHTRLSLQVRRSPRTIRRSRR